MAGTTAGQRGASGLWPGEDLALMVGLQTHCVHGCVGVLRSTGTRTSDKRAWVRGVHVGQMQSGSAARLGWPVSARGRTCMHENGVRAHE
jgi:hypothetical protein